MYLLQTIIVKLTKELNIPLKVLFFFLISPFLCIIFFLPGIIQEVSVQLLQNNLTSTEVASRQMVFHSVYLLLFLACGMFLSHAVAQVINYYVFHESKVPILRIYQTTSSSSPWPEHHNCTVKDMHRSASWLQSSESGVYLGDNEENVRESQM